MLKNLMHSTGHFEIYLFCTMVFTNKVLIFHDKIDVTGYKYS